MVVIRREKASVRQREENQGEGRDEKELGVVGEATI